MNDSLTKSSTALDERLIDLVWTHWSILGVAGYERFEPATIIDPEALLLLSTTIARHDVRLFDEILDWLRENPDRLSFQRLRQLMKTHPYGDPTVLAAMVDYLASHSSSARWRGLLRHFDPSTASAPRPLFAHLPFYGEAEPHFERWGWLRGSIQLRSMSQAPDPRRPGNFLLKLRSLFGNQARAEVIAWLLSHEHGHPAEIARQTGYFRRSIQLVLNELAASGEIRAVRLGREKHFSLDHANWHFLHAGSEAFPQWIPWAPLFDALLTLRGTLATPGLDQESITFQSIQLRQTLEAARPALKQAGLIHKMKASPDLRGQELIDALTHDLDTILGE